MESLHSLLRKHWDQEPVVGCSGAAVSAACTGVLPATDCGARRPNGRRDARPTTRRFMESLHSLLRMHWDHEPTPSPSQEGNGQDADRCLFPSWEGLGVVQFMESCVGKRICAGRPRNAWGCFSPPYSLSAGLR